MGMTRIIIVGGGFAGVKCARALRKTLPANTCEIVLFSRENNMVFYPLLAEVAGAAINPGAVTVPLRQMLPGVRCRTEEVRHIDLAASEVEYERYDGRPGRVTFDHAVLACGTAVNLSLVPGMADHAFPLKSVGDAMALRFHVMEQLEKAEVCDDPERRRWYLSFVVVGGGFTGVEVAGEINDLIRASTRFYGSFTAGEVTVTLVHSRDQILPEVSPTLREFARTKMERAGIRIVLNARAVSVTAEGVELHDGRVLRGATVVCTIGATAPLLVDRLDVPRSADDCWPSRICECAGRRTSGRSATAPASSMRMTARPHRRPASLPNGKGGKRRRTSFGPCREKPPGRSSLSRWDNYAASAGGARWPRF
jgi:NADH dehydrogenase